MVKPSRFRVAVWQTVAMMAIVISIVSFAVGAALPGMWWFCVSEVFTNIASLSKSNQ